MNNQGNGFIINNPYYPYLRDNRQFMFYENFLNDSRNTCVMEGVVIDSGHGGSDGGAGGNGINEKDFNLKVSQYMANRFKELGVPYALTKNSDETLTNEERIRRMKEPFGDTSNAIVISNHINAGGGEGAEVIYALRNDNTLATNILKELGNAGQEMRKVYQRVLPSNPNKDYYYIMRDTNNLQTTIVEYGFLDNTADANKLKNNWQKYAEATVKAVTEYMGCRYTPPGTSSDGSTYTVIAGDSLWSIADRFNTTVDEIKQLNGLTSNNLTIGQKLNISSSQTDIPDTSPTIYTVVSGDSLYSIAQKYNTTVSNIKSWNRLTNDNLSVGQKLIVSEPNEENYIFYSVNAGDSLWSIANKYGISVDKLKSVNNLTSNILSIGQQLLIPYKETYTEYNVVVGDSLWSIANRFNTTVDKLKQLNKLNSDILTIGQKLLIP